MVSMIHALPLRLVRSRHRDQPGNTRNARRQLSRRRFFEAVRTAGINIKLIVECEASSPIWGARE